jgi:hypothetical protein
MQFAKPPRGKEREDMGWYEYAHQTLFLLSVSLSFSLCPSPTGAAAISALISVGDTLLSVDGEDIQALTVEDIAPRIKGPVGSHVVLGVTKCIFRVLYVYITLQRSLNLFDRRRVMRCCQVRCHTSTMHQKNLE